MARAVFPTGRFERLTRAGGAAFSIGMATGSTALVRMLRGETVSWRDVLLTPENADRLVDALGDLRGPAAKIGQLLSMQSEELLPPSWRDALARLRDDIEPLAPHGVRQVLDDGLGRGWEDRFRSFEMQPIAAASIGQVHAAILHDGREVAVKIRYPDIDRAIRNDFANLRLALRFAPGSGVDRAGIRAFLAAAEAQLLEETDFAREAEAIRQYHAAFLHRPEIVVPELERQLCSATVITMSWCGGSPVEEVLEADTVVKNWFGELMIAVTMDEIFRIGSIQSDPNFANFRVNSAFDKLTMLDFGSVVAIPEALAADLRGWFRAILQGSETDAAVISMRILRLEDAPDANHHHLKELMRLIAQPLRSASFDFSDKSYFADIKRTVMLMVDGDLPKVDRATFAVQRRLSGLFLLCSALGVSLNIREAIEKAL